MEVSGTCPYCGQSISFSVDEGGKTHQQYIEDCAVCCRPIEVEYVAAGDEEEPYLALRRDDD